MEMIKTCLDKLLEKSTPHAPAWNMEILSGHIEPKWNYIDGCMISAILSMYDSFNDQKYLSFADEFMDHYVSDSGTISGYKKEDYNCDNINGGKALLKLYRLTGKEKYKKAADLLYAQLIDHPRISSGNFWHKLIYPHQVWLDGLYMVQPFYMEYESLFNKNQNYKDSFRQFQNVFKLMRDPATGLLYHGYDETKSSAWANPETGCSRNFWTRSLGWCAMALTDTLEFLDEQFFNESQILQEQLKTLLDAIMQCQDPETGMFYQVTDQGGREGNYLETSGTCAIAYSLLKGARRGYLHARYRELGMRIFKSVSDNKLLINEDGMILKDICLVAGLGVYEGKGDYKERDGSYAYYISEPRVDNDAKGLAPFLMAYAECNRKGD